MIGVPVDHFLCANQMIDEASSGIVDAEITGIRSDGLELPLLMRRCEVENSATGDIIIFLMDLSEFKNIEQELYHQATHDSLTGLYNRRHLECTAQREYAVMLRSKQPLTAIMFDIDHFKQVNDTYGHAVGDQVLQALASRITPRLRQEDQLFRSGGEEFVLLLPDTSATEATIIAEKIRTVVSRKPIQTDEGDSLTITISLGIETIEKALPGGYTELLANADAAMYHAKRTGRDRLVLYRHMDLSERIRRIV